MTKRHLGENVTRRAVLALWLLTTGADGAVVNRDVLVMPGVISTGAAEVRIAYRPDGRQILWGSIGREGARDQQDIWEVHRTRDGWSSPARTSFDTDAVEFDPAFSADSRHLYFDSDRPNGYGGTDIYVAEVRGYDFSPPRNMGSSVNSKGDEWAATPTRSGTLIFSSDGWGGAGKHDLFESDPHRTGEPRNLGPAVNSPAEDFDAALSPSGKTLVFSSGTMSDSAAEVALFTSGLERNGWSQRRALGLGCSNFQIGAAFARSRPGRLFYSAACPDGSGRMDVREIPFNPERQ